MNSLSLTANSAWSTLLILDRQARRNAGKVARFSYRVYRALSSREAKKTYVAMWRLFQCACLLAIALGASARDTWEWVRAAMDRYVESCLETPQAEPTAPVEPAPQSAEVDAWDLPIEPAAPVAPAPVPVLPTTPILLLPAAKVEPTAQAKPVKTSPRTKSTKTAAKSKASKASPRTKKVKVA